MCVHLLHPSSDGKNLAAGGRSNLLHLWCLDSRQLVRVLQMPAVVRTVRQLHFLPDSFDGGASEVHTHTHTHRTHTHTHTVCIDMKLSRKSLKSSPGRV